MNTTAAPRQLLSAFSFDEERCTGALRFERRRATGGCILQQEWVVKTYTDGTLTAHKTVWRDVPLVEQAEG